MNVKRCTFWLMTFVVGILFVEFVAFTTMAIITRSVPPQAKSKARMLSVLSKNNPPTVTREVAGEMNWGGQVVEVIHPFLGYVCDPHKTPGVSEYGFAGTSVPILKRTQDALIVAVTGGSFAQGIGATASETLKINLQSLGKKVTVLNLGLGGYKQPQQLFTLTWLITLGAQFDIVINVDGFNEIVLPMADNVSRRIFPLFPRAWHFRVAGIKDPNLLRRLGSLSNAEEKRRKLAGFFLEKHLYVSATLCACWKGLDRWLEDVESRARLDANRYEQHVDESYMATGPPFTLAEGQDKYDYLASYWARCSVQMNALCKSNGIRYYHFLQPNQYVEGSKPMDADEIAIAINNEGSYPPHARNGYPFLRKYCPTLAEKGVNAHDLTMIFSTCREPLYVDSCCHVSEKGYRMVAETISRTILEDGMILSVGRGDLPIPLPAD